MDTDTGTDQWLPEEKRGGRVKWVKGSNVWWQKRDFWWRACSRVYKYQFMMLYTWNLDNIIKPRYLDSWLTRRGNSSHIVLTRNFLVLGDQDKQDTPPALGNEDKPVSDLPRGTQNAASTEPWSLWSTCHLPPHESDSPRQHRVKETASRDHRPQRAYCIQCTA